MTLATQGKDPAAVRRGRLGASRRWSNHTPTVVRLDSLGPEARHLITLLIRAAREADRDPGAAEREAPTT